MKNWGSYKVPRSLEWWGWRCMRRISPWMMQDRTSLARRFSVKDILDKDSQQPRTPWIKINMKSAYLCFIVWGSAFIRILKPYQSISLVDGGKEYSKSYSTLNWQWWSINYRSSTTHSKSCDGTPLTINLI